jgi:hypothetical protein
MSGWGISELKEMDVEELIFWLRKASKLAEREVEELRKVP